MLSMVFIIVVFAEVLLGGSLVITMIYPKHRVWPPPRKSSWQFYYTWILTVVSVMGFILLGILDWDSFIYSHFSRFIIGGSLVIGGTFFAVWGLSTLRVHSSLGLEGELITSGPYQYSRNPQYVGDIAIFIGLVLIFNSQLALITGFLGILWFILAAFAEEPWLRDRFGRKYDEYCKKVPRFI